MRHFSHALLVTALLLAALLFGSVAHGQERFFYQRGDVGDVKCYSKSYLRRHIGKNTARRLFRENPDARSLCGVLQCRGERSNEPLPAQSRLGHCRFDALVFVDERPVVPILKRPPVRAHRR